MSFNPHLPPLHLPGLSGSNAVRNSLCSQQLYAISHVDDSSSNIFCEIFQIPFGKRHFRSYSDLTFASFNGYNLSTKVPSFSIHFDSLLKELLKIGSIHDSIFYRVGAVKGELQNLLLFFGTLCLKLFHGNHGSHGERKGVVQTASKRHCKSTCVFETHSQFHDTLNLNFSM